MNQLVSVVDNTDEPSRWVWDELVANPDARSGHMFRFEGTKPLHHLLDRAHDRLERSLDRPVEKAVVAGTAIECATEFFVRETDSFSSWPGVVDACHRIEDDNKLGHPDRWLIPQWTPLGERNLLITDGTIGARVDNDVERRIRTLATLFPCKGDNALLRHLLAFGLWRGFDLSQWRMPADELPMGGNAQLLEVCVNNFYTELGHRLRNLGHAGHIVPNPQSRLALPDGSGGDFD